MPVLPANSPEDMFWHLSNNPIVIGKDSWYLRSFQPVVRSNTYRLTFENYYTKPISITITIKEEQLVSAYDPITLIKETLRSSIVSSMNQPLMDKLASVKADFHKPEDVQESDITKFVADFLKPVGHNHNIATISAETTAGIATTSSKYLTINTTTTTNTVNNQGENKMDANTMLAYIVANTDKVTKLIYKWGTEDSWETDSIIMLDYTYERDVVIKKNKVVDACGEEVKVYTATVFKAKNGKWYSSLQNNNLHGVEFSDVINFFENSVVVISARSFERDKGSTFIYKGQASD